MNRLFGRLQAMWITLRVWVELRRDGFSAMAHKHLNSASSTPAPPQRQRLSARADLLASGAAAPWSTCLTRSVALLRYAHEIGVAGTLRIAPSATGDRFEAHAWVEFGAWTTENSPPDHWLDAHDQ